MANGLPFSVSFFINLNSYIVRHAFARSGNLKVTGLIKIKTINKMAKSKQKQPNILVVWGDDIGITNLSCYSHGLMGYQTPNIDRIAKEGMMFTDSYGEQSCTAGRASFITGQSVYRTGLSKVGIPGAPVGHE